MTRTEQPLAALAQALARARLRGSTLEAPQLELSLSQAYAVQAQVTARIGGRPAGWKVGSTSIAAQRRLGTDEPGAGRLLQRFVYADNEYVPVFPVHHAQVEVEFAFRIGRALPPRIVPYAASELRQHIAAFIPAMELVGSRFNSGLDGSGRGLVTADGGANVAMVCGTEIPLPKALDLPSQQCRLYRNASLLSQGEGAAALGDPIQVLTWLANHLSRRGLTLEDGEIVSTGTCTGLLPVKPGDRLRADFGTLGTVQCTIIDASKTD